MYKVTIIISYRYLLLSRRYDKLNCIILCNHRINPCLIIPQSMSTAVLKAGPGKL